MLFHITFDFNVDKQEDIIDILSQIIGINTHLLQYIVYLFYILKMSYLNNDVNLLILEYEYSIV